MGSSDAIQARERLAAIGEIAAEIAHELRNLLQTISARAFVARVELGKADGAGAVPHVAKVERIARVGHTLVDDLMALARGEPLGRTDIALGDVVHDAQAEFPADAARWDDSFAPADLIVRAHATLISRLLRVLYENAIQACAPRRAVVTTRGFREEGRIVVEVVDDGPGVDEAFASRVFEPLFSARPGGTGLGLALARRIATAHGGSLVLRPSAGSGAHFRIELPADA